MSERRITRRGLVGIVAGATAAAAQAPPAAIPSTPEQELEGARAQAKGYAEQIAKVKLPMSVEPAVHFKA